MGLNRNVQLALVFSFLMSASRGVWAFTTLSVYLRDITGSSADVGLAEGLQGLAMAACAVLAGLGADATQNRDRLLHVAGVVGLAATACAMAALLVPGLSDRKRFWALTCALCAQGGFQGISSTCIDTLFADSVKTGERSKFNTYRFALIQLSSVSGPFICVSIFYHYGNTWTRARLTLVFMVGLSLMTVPTCILFLFSERYALGDESESHYIPSTPGGSSSHYQRLVDEVLEEQEQQRRSGSGTAMPASASMRELLRDASSGRTAAGAASTGRRTRRGRQSSGPMPMVLGTAISPWDEARFGAQHAPRASSGSQGQDMDRFETPLLERDPEARRRGLALLLVPTSCCGLLGQQHISSVLIVSDVISALGSGMTVKFFPLFFKIRLGLSPVAVNFVYIALPIFMTAVSLGSRRLAKYVGRIQTCIVLSLAGCASLAGLAMFADDPEPSVYAVLGIYMLSTVQHSSRPLRKAVLMDYVEKARRARFNSIDSVTRLNWSGSAFLGGLAIDRSGFGRLFLVTAVIQAVSALLLFVLLPLVPIHESRRRLDSGDDPAAEDLLAEMEDSVVSNLPGSHALESRDEEDGDFPPQYQRRQQERPNSYPRLAGDGSSLA